MKRTRFLLVVIVLAACGGPNKPAPPSIGNTGGPEPAPAAPAAAATLAGTITDGATGSPVGGVTLVAVSPSNTGELVFISNEDGSYRFEGIAPGPYVVTMYYSDLAYRRELAVDGPTTMNQQINTAGSGGTHFMCAGETFDSCRPSDY
jgi:hypothetical protein